MNAKCHNCGREYMTARTLAGKRVVCRSCKAWNDGAGGPPPVAPVDAHAGNSNEPSSGNPLAGAAFDVGETQKRPDPRVVAAAEVKAAIAVAQATAARPQAQRVGAMNRVVMAMGIGAALLAVVVVGGLLFMRFLQSPSSREHDWTSAQLAVPQVVSSRGSGSGFIIEEDGRLWVVTNFAVIGGAREVALHFRDPRDGRELFRLPGLRTANFTVDLGIKHYDDLPHFGIGRELVALSVETYRPQLEAIGVAPLKIAALDELRAGLRVVAFGHPSSSAVAFDVSENPEGAGMAVHSIFDGIISGVRLAGGRPTLLQTNAAVTDGCVGGPIIVAASGEVAGVTAWVGVDPNSDGTVVEMSYALTAEPILAAIRDGARFQRLRGELINLARAPVAEVADGELEEVDWPTFPKLGAAVEAMKTEGWTFATSKVAVTDDDGSFIGIYQTTGPRSVEIAIFAMPKDPRIDLDVGGVEVAGTIAAASDNDSAPGIPTLVMLNIPGSEQLLQVAPRDQISVPIQTYIGRALVPARFVLVIMERPVADAARTQPRSRASESSRAPQTETVAIVAAREPDASEQSSLSATESEADSSPPLAPSVAQGGVASAVELHDGMAPVVFASSLIGLREFDLRFLTNQSSSDAFDQLNEAFVTDTHSFHPDDPRFAEDIMWASLFSRFYFRSAPDKLGLPDTRPLFEVHLTNVPAQTRAGVYLDIDPAWRRYLSLGSTGLVSKSDAIELVPSISKADGRFTAEDGHYHLALQLPWNDEELRRLDHAFEIPYTVRVKYQDGTEDAMSGRMRVNPPTEVEQLYPFGLGFAALVDETHPWIKQLMDEINHDPKVVAAGLSIAGSGGTAEDALVSIYLVWRELVLRGMRYQNLTAADVGAQRCRSVHESLSAANANCIDGAILLASFIEAMGLEAHLVMTPGHALVCARLGGDSILFIETTMLSQTPAKGAKTYLDELFDPIRAKNAFFKDPSFDSFEVACAAGLEEVVRAHNDAQPILSEFRRLRQLMDQSSSAPIDEFLLQCAQLGRQVQVVPVSLARKNGVRPLGAPTNINAKFRIPPRRSN